MAFLLLRRCSGGPPFQNPLYPEVTLMWSRQGRVGGGWRGEDGELPRAGDPLEHPHLQPGRPLWALRRGWSWKRNRPGSPDPDAEAPAARPGPAPEGKVVPGGIRNRKEVDCIIFIV